MSRRARVAAIALAVVLGGALRVWHARSTLFVHGDEIHVAGDALWLALPWDTGTRLHFLYAHASDHQRVSQRDGRPVSWSGERAGHATLLPLVAGVPVAVAGATTPKEAVPTVRVVVALADTAVVALLPMLCSALGASAGAGVLAAFVHACFPPAVAFGSLVYPEAFVAPLVVLALALAARAGATTRRAAAAGLVTGLACLADHAGVAAGLAVPVLLATAAARPPAALAAWAATAAVTIAALVTPGAWLAITAKSLAWREPLSNLVANLGWLATPLRWYWTGFTRHPRPLAPALAFVIPVAAPAVLLAGALGTVALALRGWGRALAATALPALLVLALMPASDGVMRLHVVWALAAASLGCALAASGAVGRVALLAPALAAGVLPVLPARPDAKGVVDQASVLFMNPQHLQGTTLQRADQPLPIELFDQEAVSRRVLLRPGRWRFFVAAIGFASAEVDGKPVIEQRPLSPRVDQVEVQLDGWVHEVRVRSTIGTTKLYGFGFMPPSPTPAPAPDGQPPS